jgi:hypothetical protein
MHRMIRNKQRRLNHWIAIRGDCPPYGIPKIRGSGFPREQRIKIGEPFLKTGIQRGLSGSVNSLKRD